MKMPEIRVNVSRRHQKYERVKTDALKDLDHTVEINPRFVIEFIHQVYKR
jgi:hypothetical protein